MITDNKMDKVSEIERVQELMDSEFIGPTELGEIIGISKSTISTWKSRGKTVPSKYLYKIADKFPKYSRDWLINGTGPKYAKDILSVVNDERSDYDASKIILNREEFNKMLSIQESQQRTIEIQSNLIDRLTKNNIAGGA